MEERMRQLSLRLFNTLEGVGASEEMRHFYRRNLTSEIINSVEITLSNGKSVAMYYFGSFSEGTTTLDMGFDIDNFISDDSVNVYTDINTIPDMLSFLLVYDEDSYPGYVKLQLVINRRPITMEPGAYFDSDRQGRMCFKHTLLDGFQRHGPADTEVVNGHSFDIVHARRCITIPDFAMEWLKRCQRNGWPSAVELARMSQMNCFVVGVGHESSPEKHIEWRLSFSLHEREIMFNLNPVQHKCYILMKMIKKDIIEPVIGNECLSSYHCKTVLFHTIENSSRDIWRPDNLIQCLMLCFLNLHHAVMSSFCPLFFLSEVNLFDRESFRQHRLSLLHEIENILKQGYRIIGYIQCSNVGDSFNNQRIPRYITENVIKMKYLVHHIIANPPVCRGWFYRLNQSNNLNEMIYKVYNTLHNLKNTTTITEHSEQQTRDALSLIIPHIHHRLAVSLAACAMEARDEQKRKGFLRLSDGHFQYSQSVDVMSATLTYVTVLYRLGEFELCRAVLEEKERDLKQHVVSNCSCRAIKNEARNLTLFKKIEKENMSQLCFMTTAVVSCVMFLPTESTIVHPALKFEMVRSIGTIHGSRNEDEEYWFDCAVVDGNVYFYFLQYLVYSSLNKPVDKQVAMDNLKRVIGDDKELGHPETAYNLLGWIYNKEDRVGEALECWKRSWKIRPDHNAAKWHSTWFLVSKFGQ